MDTQDLKSYFDQNFATKKDLLDSQEEIAKKIKEGDQETRRHMGVLHEDLVRRFDTLLEIISPYEPKLESHEERLQALETDMDVVKMVIRKR